LLGFFQSLPALSLIVSCRLQITNDNILSNDDELWEAYQFGDEIIVLDLPSDEKFGNMQGAAAASLVSQRTS